MNYTADILARLQKGEAIEDIAAQLTKEINEANTKYIAEQEKLKAEKEKNDERLAAANNAIRALTEVIGFFMTEAQYQRFVEEMNDFTGQDLLDLLKELVPSLLQLIELQEALNDKTRKGIEKVKAAPTKMEDPIEKFLNTFVR